jgi:5-deoxy-glucuronate isomerase
MSTAPVRHIRPGTGPGTLIDATPASVGWQFLSFRIVSLTPGETFAADSAGSEVAIVPIGGSGSFAFAGTTHPISRTSVFSERPASSGAGPTPAAG